MKTHRRLLFLLLTVTTAAPAYAQRSFHLRPGDRVVFFGDSITEQRLYTTFVETFVLTRFPTLAVRFVHSGWGGDRVSGGGGGHINLRLRRDVFAHSPTVVTIMLGMNDGRYRPFDEEVFRTFSTGYERMVREIGAALPGARLTLIQPSPYDDVTRPPMEGGSYNEVLRRYGAFVKRCAVRERALVADLNTDLVAVLEKANKRSAELAQGIIRDRVHPGPGGHLIMAASLLKAWHAPALVSAVELDGGRGRVVTARNARVSDLAAADKGLRWSQADAALPMPVNVGDPVIQLAVESSDFVQALNQQPLKVTGLPVGSYALRIDGEHVGVFRQAELTRGINLALLPTPMTRQAAEVHALTLKHNEMHFLRWRSVELKVDKEESAASLEALQALDALEEDLVRRQRAAARPGVRLFELAPVSEVAASIPPGYAPVLGNGTPRYTLVAAEARKNVDIHLELAPDGDGAAALLVRLDRGGRGYRVALDGGEGGALGRVAPDPGRAGKASPAPAWQAHWKKGEWNTVRVRVTGEAPHITVWLNGTQINDWLANERSGAVADEEGGAIALDASGGSARGRFRNVAVKTLP